MEKENMNKSGHVKINHNRSPFSANSNLINVQNENLSVREKH